jgi:hypothetical protein
MSIWSTFGRRWAALPYAIFDRNPLVQSGGIQFPATQVPSADPNALDDYEEGTWTPAISFGGGTTGITYTTQSGRYTKIGRQVFAQAHTTFSSKGSSTGGAVLSGLPFNVGGITAPMSVGFYNAMASITGAIHGTASGTQVSIYHSAATASTQLTDTNFTNTSSLVFGVFYTV